MIRTFTNWRKSSRSSAADNCVEVAQAADSTIGLRDSKDPAGPVLQFAPTDWTAFTSAIHDGQLPR